jgi:signal transduction histidine kinase
MKNNINIVEQLNELNVIANKLSECLTFEEVVKVALKQVRNRLNSQVASVFLFNKNGVLARAGIDGVDKNNDQVENDSFADEQYEPGQSFSGQPVPPVGKLGYGTPCYSDNLLDEYPDIRERKKEYLDKLGSLKSGISVPLNGFHRTFGTLEIINKNDGDGNNFVDNDVYSLTLIATFVSRQFSHIKRNNRESVHKEITEGLFRVTYSRKKINLDEITSSLVNSLISETMPYKVCIIRKIDENGVFKDIVKKGTEDINWDNRNPNSLCIGESEIVAQVCDKEKAFYATDLTEAINQENFHNPTWIKENKLESIAILPLSANGKTLGTISVYTGYKRNFSEGNKRFLGNIASVLASIVAIDKIKNDLRATERELAEERHKFFATSRQVGYDSVMQGFLHQYKNELMELSEVFSQLSEDSSKSINQKQQIINTQRGWIKKRVAEISEQFREDSTDSDVVNINKSIKYVATLFVSDEPDIELSANYYDEIPEIEVSEAKIKDVIYNLVNNAIAAIKRAGRKKGQLSVATNIITLERIQYIEIIIQDNGDGIRNEIHDRIFEQGFTTRAEDGGTGMGLFVANAVITDYGGKISVNSKVGHGTIFKVYIPLKRYRI